MNPIEIGQVWVRRLDFPDTYWTKVVISRTRQNLIDGSLMYQVTRLDGETAWLFDSELRREFDYVDT